MDQLVREHPAPSGALRHPLLSCPEAFVHHGQGAPSTIRCIKTRSAMKLKVLPKGQGAPSTIRCIKT